MDYKKHQTPSSCAQNDICPLGGKVEGGMRGGVSGQKTEREMHRRRQLLCPILPGIFSGASERIKLMGHKY